MNPNDPRVVAVRDAWGRLVALGTLDVTVAQAAAFDELMAAIKGLNGPHPAAVAYAAQRARPCPDCGNVGYSDSGQKWHRGGCVQLLTTEQLRERLRVKEGDNG